MGRRITNGGVAAKGDRIQFDFVFPSKGGKRYRPTVDIPPTEANLRKARVRLDSIKQKIKYGTFLFYDEFPEYRLDAHVSTDTEVLFDEIAERFLETIKGEVAHATYESYRKILAHHWSPQFGRRGFLGIKATEIRAFIGGAEWGSNKTRNNVVSATAATPHWLTRQPSSRACACSAPSLTRHATACVRTATRRSSLLAPRGVHADCRAGYVTAGCEDRQFVQGAYVHDEPTGTNGLNCQVAAGGYDEPCG